MKKIKCQQCNGVWIVDDSDLQRQKVCPYCISPIQKKKEIKEFNSLDKVIYGAVSKMGIEIIKNPQQLNGLMMDMAPALRKEIRIFSKTVTDEYVGYVKETFVQDMETAKATINKLRTLFIEEEGLSETWADMICNGLLDATLYYKGKIQTELINVQVDNIYNTDFLHIQKYQPNLQKQKSQAAPANNKVHQNKNSVSSVAKTGDSLNKSAKGLCELAMKYYYGKPYYPRDERKAIKLLREAAIYHQYVPAYNYLGRIFMKSQNYANAEKWYKKSAEASDAEGCCMEAYFVYTGRVDSKSNGTTASKYYMNAAATSEFELMITISEKFFTGNEVPKNEQVAVDILTAASKAGSAEAQYHLGQCYQHGRGVEIDCNKAVEFYKMATANGFSKAKTELDSLQSDLSFSEKVRSIFS